MHAVNVPWEMIVGASICLLICSTILILNSTIDLAYDLFRGWIAIRRRFFKPVHRQDVAMESRKDQWIAVMVAAFEEQDVIGATLTRLVSTNEYDRYVVFVGIYANDSATLSIVHEMAEKFPKIVPVYHDVVGPTTKGNCLNAILVASREFEVANGIQFQIFVVHDSEDIIHPFGLALYDRLMPEKPVVQLPILPAPDHWSQVVHWIYADEFAEGELKDLPVRQEFFGFVPLLGVGSAFSRQTIDHMSHVGGGEVFPESALTDDYSLALSMHIEGIEVYFVEPHVNPSVFSPLARNPLFLSNWSFFPNQIGAAIRQRARWIIGISIQEWKRAGWPGDYRMKLTLYKDRRVILMLPVLTLSIAASAMIYVADYRQFPTVHLPWHQIPFLWGVGPNLLDVMVTLFIALTSIRIVQRAMYVSITYGLTQGIFSVLRFPLAILINILATYRALFIYLHSEVSGTQIGWNKTKHTHRVVPD